MSNNSESFNGNFEGLVKYRGGDKAPGDGYDLGDRPFADDAYGFSDDTRSARSSHSRSTRDMDRDRYEPSQYGDRGSVARDGYERDAQSDAYQQSQYGGNDRRYSASTSTYVDRDRRRSYDDHDVDGYYERTRLTKYKRDNDRGLEVYREGDRERARSQDYRRDERPSSRGRRGSGSEDERDYEREGERGYEREGDENTPVKKWAATLAGAAVGGIAANRFQKGHENNWVPTAIGAVVGGLLGREVEKKVYEHKEHKERRKEREYEESY